MFREEKKHTVYNKIKDIKHCCVVTSLILLQVS